MNSRGQSAIEYMSTYGWAILIIILIGTILWQMGAFSPPTAPPDCRGFSEVTVLDHRASGNTLSLVITNEAGTRLRILQNGISAGIGDASCNIPSGAPSSDLDPFRPGESQKVEITCDALADQYASGEYFRAYINITYTNLASGLEHTSTGTCWGSVQ